MCLHSECLYAYSETGKPKSSCFVCGEESCDRQGCRTVVFSLNLISSSSNLLNDAYAVASAAQTGETKPLPTCGELKWTKIDCS